MVDLNESTVSLKMTVTQLQRTLCRKRSNSNLELKKSVSKVFVLKNVKVKT